MKLRNLPGGVPEPDELIGREHLIESAWEQLAGNNILLVAPRRFGKTGVMKYMLKCPHADFLPLYIDVEEISTPEAFATELIAALLSQNKLRSLMAKLKKLPRAIAECLQEHVEEVSVDELFQVKLREELGESWQSVVKKLILEMEKASEMVVFMIDEFPQFIENVAKSQGNEAARGMLAWFRSLRMRQKDELRNFRVIIGGSTGIDQVLRSIQAFNGLNDFFRIPVEAVSRKDGEVILKGVAENCKLNFTQEGVDRFFELIGPSVPYFIHLFISQIIIDTQSKNREIDSEYVQQVYHNRLIGPACRGYFDVFRQRLKRYGVTGERAAIAVLRRIAEASEGRVADSTLYDTYQKERKKGASEVEFQEIMADLECDWYVSLDTATNEYFFLMEIMRDWWKRFYRSIGPKK